MKKFVTLIRSICYLAKVSANIVILWRLFNARIIPSREFLTKFPMILFVSQVWPLTAKAHARVFGFFQVNILLGRNPSLWQRQRTLPATVSIEMDSDSSDS